MALNITVPEIAAAIRLQDSPTDTVVEPHLSILARQRSVAEARIELYAADAPDDVKDEAAVRMVGYLYDAPPVSRNPSSAFILSGAKDILSGWHDEIRAEVVV